eukprot:GHVR01049055.1.p1 GENE.GHVR01049055.1~~GHVR01049055.1.p1  ORF type:complete len:231 (+),score=141.49 GHVR01049055.1:43-735(+)
MIVILEMIINLIHTHTHTHTHTEDEKEVKETNNGNECVCVCVDDTHKHTHTQTDIEYCTMARVSVADEFSLLLATDVSQRYEKLTQFDHHPMRNPSLWIEHLKSLQVKMFHLPSDIVEGGLALLSARLATRIVCEATRVEYSLAMRQAEDIMNSNFPRNFAEAHTDTHTLTHTHTHTSVTASLDAVHSVCGALESCASLLPFIPQNPSAISCTKTHTHTHTHTCKHTRRI